MNKRCAYCSHEGHLINQGILWCELQHQNMEAENCPDYDEIPVGITSSISTEDDSLYSHDGKGTLVVPLEVIPENMNIEQFLEGWKANDPIVMGIINTKCTYINDCKSTNQGTPDGSE